MLSEWITYPNASNNGDLLVELSKIDAQFFKSANLLRGRLSTVNVKPILVQMRRLCGLKHFGTNEFDPNLT